MLTKYGLHLVKALKELVERLLVGCLPLRKPAPAAPRLRVFKFAPVTAIQKPRIVTGDACCGPQAVIARTTQVRTRHEFWQATATISCMARQYRHGRACRRSQPSVAVKKANASARNECTRPVPRSTLVPGEEQRMKPLIQVNRHSVVSSGENVLSHIRW